MSVDLRSKQPSGWLLGADHLLRIRGDQLAFYADMQRRFGDAVCLRLGPYRSWLLFHPELIEPVLTRHAGSFIRFRRLTRVLRQWNGNSLIMTEGQDWRDRRRKVLPAFQTRRLPAYGEAIVQETSALIDRLIPQADAAGAVSIDTDKVMARLTLDIAARTLFGSTPPANGDEIENAVQRLSGSAFAETTAPIILPDLMALPSKRSKLQAISTMNDYVSDLVRKALRRSGAGGADLIASLIEHHEGDFTSIRDDAMSLLIAGHETSGALLSWISACLACNPQWIESAQAEIAENVVGTVSASDLHRLRAVKAIIDETLRLYPPAYTLFLREAVTEVDLPGAHVKRGDLVQIVTFTTQRDPRFFNAPESFDPGRFLRDADWPDYAYIPFGAGPRSCIGQNFGLMEAALVLVTLLQRMSPEPLRQMPEPLPRFSLRPLGGLPMRWRLRQA